MIGLMGDAVKIRMRGRLLASGAVLALMLGGCTVNMEPITGAEHTQRVTEDLKELFEQQEPIQGAITLEEAIARALKNNLDNRLKLMESALTSKQLTVANLEMLPALAASGGYEGRNTPAASSSRSVLNGQQSLEQSTSQDRDRRVFDLGVTWNVLDFGVSYVRAKQAADRSLIIEERRRKVTHNIIQDVRSAYWFALSAQKLLTKLDPMATRVATALANARTIEERRLQPPLEALTYRRGLLDQLRQVQQLRRELVSAKAQLAALMGVRPGQAFTLAEDPSLYKEPELKLQLADIERLALTYRPELAEETYQTRIGANDVRAAMLSMLPGITFDTGFNFDSNSYAVSQTWYDYSAKVTGNLISMLVTGPARIRAAEAAQEVARTRRLALSMAVLTQAQVSWLAYSQARVEYRTMEELYQVETSILQQSQAARQTGRSNELEQISADMSALLAELRRDLAAAEMNNALGRIFVTAGADPMPDKVTSYETKALAQEIKQHMAGWFDGSTLPDAMAQKPGVAADQAPASQPVASQPAVGQGGTPVAAPPASTPAAMSAGPLPKISHAQDDVARSSIPVASIQPVQR